MPGLPPIIVSLVANTSEFSAKIAAAKAELGGLEDTGNKRMGGLGHAGQMAAVGVAAIVVAAVAAGAASVKMASDFQASTTQLITGAGESEANIDLVRKGILAMAGAVGTMPAELSKGLYLIESAGYHGAQGLAVLKAAAEGAKVGGADMAVVANGLTTAMTDYHIPASRANAVTSALVATVADGKMKMEDLANSLGAVMPKASAMGVSFQDVTGALATMTGAGMSAHRASMNLAQTILSLGAPSHGAALALKAIGLSAQGVKDDLSSKGLAGTLELIEEHVGTKFPKGSVAAVTALQSILGGTMGYGTALALTGTHMAAFEANVKNIGGALGGQAKNVAGFALTQKDLAFQVDAAKATISAWGITLGTELLPIVTKAMEFFNTTAIPAIKNFAASFTTNVLPVLKQVAAFITDTVVPAIKDFIKGFQDGTGAGGTFRDVLTKIGTAIGVTVTAGLAFLGFMRDHNELAKTAAAVIGLMVLAVQAHNVALFISSGRLTEWIAQTTIVKTATAVWAAGQWLLNAALTANPIGLVVVAVGLLVGGIILIATKTTWFQTIWKGMTDVLATAWQWLWNGILAPIIRFVLNGFASIVDGIANMIRVLSNIPGFGWAKDAADKMAGAADKAHAMANGIKDIPAHVAVDVSFTSNYSVIQAQILNLAQSANKLGAMGIGHNAAGTNNWRGGLTMVGERGPEIVNLPKGSQVIPNDKIGTAGGGSNADLLAEVQGLRSDVRGLVRSYQTLQRKGA